MSQFVDLNVFGNENPNGEPVTHFDDEAISNALSMWLSTKRGEVVNQPNEGGALDSLIFKNLNSNPLPIQTRLRRDIERAFGGVLRVNSIQVQPDFDTKTWKIALVITSFLTGNKKEIEINIATVTSFQPRPKFVDLPLIGENLLNYITVEQISQPNEKLLFNEVEQSFVWGKFKLVNFTQSDTKFTEILALLNG